MGRGLEARFVITSYSIHYTKLYDDHGAAAAGRDRPGPRAGRRDGAGAGGLNVITSYSIHYTKLYEVGERFASSSSLLTILAVPTLFALPQSAASSVLFGISRHRGVVALSLLNAVVNLGLSILWVRPFGLEGVAFGTAIPLFVVAGLGMMVFGARALVV